ncbi:CCHC-type domain-containing protein [Citrus sinensis]|nr:CCHC-type domain-containing protein [Citrus sinensis]
MASTKLEVEKFTGKNDFHLWRLKIRALLVHQRLDVALDDESSSKKPMKVIEEELSEVLDRAHSAIIISLGDGVLKEVGGEKTAARLWKKLEDLYTKKSMAKRLTIKKKLYTLQMEEGSSIIDHIDAFNKIILDPEDINVKIDDENKAMILLCSLSSSYENLVDTLMELRDVRHVPDLKRNLISLGMLDKIECLVKLESGTLKVMKGSMVVMKGNVSNGLYVLQGSTVTGDVAVSNQNLNKTMLWHLRPAQTASLGGARYPVGVKGYKLWCTYMKAPRTIISKDVVFNEHEIFQNSATVKQTIERDSGCDKKTSFEVELLSSSTEADTITRPENAPRRDFSEQEEESEGDDDLRDYQLVRDRKKRESKPPKRYAYADLIVFALSAAQGIEVDEPKTYTEAVSSKDSKKWIAAMDEEIRSLIKNHTWDLIPKPAKKKVVGYKWIYKIKEGIPRVEPLRFKARLVAKGFTQKEVIDFNEVFSPVVRHSSLRILLTLVAVNDMHLEQMDVKTAFLHGELEEIIVMAQPRGYENPYKADYVCLLKKSLYGLKQSPRQCKIYLLLYVDDMLIACKHMDQIDELKKQLKNAFEMKDLGAAKKILGVELLRDTHFRLSCNQCPRTEDEKAEMSTIPYSSVVGCLMYAMVLTRPDISYAVSVVSMYMANPGKKHWRAVKWILRYLSGTTDYGLIYRAKRGTKADVKGYADADYTGDLDKR